MQQVASMLLEYLHSFMYSFVGKDEVEMHHCDNIQLKKRSASRVEAVLPDPGTPEYEAWVASPYYKNAQAYLAKLPSGRNDDGRVPEAWYHIYLSKQNNAAKTR